jgi:hypothetical protein
MLKRGNLEVRLMVMATEKRLKKKKRAVRSFSLSPRALEALKQIKRDDGLNQQEILSRTVEWLASRGPQERIRIYQWAQRQRIHGREEGRDLEQSSQNGNQEQNGDTHN